ncbi:MAG: dihydroneopterin aldolase family protein [Candidatus Freyarchaeota archaeon]|nr:dihydroneopterin aldolase family protein [Candidatus Freyrarchaeum guaymaensis]
MGDKDVTRGFFGREVSERDRAIFEAGIKLGAIYHQFVGVPVSKESIPLIERAIEKAVSCQPYVKSVEVKIKEGIGDVNVYGYSEVSGRNLSVRLVVEYGAVKVTARLDYIPELNYPLMFIEKVEG